MRTEKIFKLEDGSRLKVVTDLMTSLSKDAQWRSDVYICEKGKRTFKSIYNTNSWEYRKRSMDERKEYIESLQVIYKDFILEAQIEAWDKIKPKDSK